MQKSNRFLIATLMRFLARARPALEAAEAGLHQHDQRGAESTQTRSRSGADSFIEGGGARWGERTAWVVAVRSQSTEQHSRRDNASLETLPRARLQSSRDRFRLPI